MKKQYRFLTMGALMGLLLTGVMPQAQAQDLDGTQFGGVGWHAIWWWCRGK